MVPASFSSFLIASTGASASLIGLLFVAISIAPDRVFGRRGLVARQVQALSAFTALVDAFFVSLGGLVPGIDIGVVAIVMGLLAMSQTPALLFHVGRRRREGGLVSGLVVFLISGVVYGYQIWVALRLIRTPSATDALVTLLGLLLGTYAIGLERAWELLGAPEGRGLTASLRALFTPSSPEDS